MREFLSQHRSHDYPYLVKRWREVARRHNLNFHRFCQVDGYWLYYARSKRVRGPRRPAVYLSAGIHGDEVGSTEGLLYWAENSAELLAQVDITILPCLNPWGLVANTRLDKSGTDLNRNFQNQEHPMVAGLFKLLTGRHFDLSLCLHEDYDAQGLYVYEVVPRNWESWSAELIETGALVIGPDLRARIEGRQARRGAIRRISIPKRMYQTMPESLFLYCNGFTRRSYTVETPSEFSLHDRRHTHADFVTAAIRKLLSAGGAANSHSPSNSP